MSNSGLNVTSPGFKLPADLSSTPQLDTGYLKHVLSGLITAVQDLSRKQTSMTDNIEKLRERDETQVLALDAHKACIDRLSSRLDLIEPSIAQARQHAALPAALEALAAEVDAIQRAASAPAPAAGLSPEQSAAIADLSVGQEKLATNVAALRNKVLFWDDEDKRRTAALQSMHDRVDSLDEQLRCAETSLSTAMSHSRAAVDSFRTHSDALTQLVTERMAACDDRIRSVMDRINETVAQTVTRVEFKAANEAAKTTVRPSPQLIAVVSCLVLLAPTCLSTARTT